MTPRTFQLAVFLIPLLLSAAQAADPNNGAEGTSLLGEEGPGEFDFWSYAINMMLVLGFVIGLILLIVWLLRLSTGRRFSLGGGGLLQMVASVPLGDRRFISVLRVGRKYYLIGISGGEIRLLTDLDPEEVEEHIKTVPGKEEGGFAAILSRFRRQKDEDSGQ